MESIQGTIIMAKNQWLDRSQVVGEIQLPLSCSLGIILNWLLMSFVTPTDECIFQLSLEKLHMQQIAISEENHNWLMCRK